MAAGYAGEPARRQDWQTGRRAGAGRGLPWFGPPPAGPFRHPKCWAAGVPPRGPNTPVGMPSSLLPRPKPLTTVPRSLISGCSGTVSPMRSASQEEGARVGGSGSWAQASAAACRAARTHAAQRCGCRPHRPSAALRPAARPAAHPQRAAARTPLAGSRAGWAAAPRSPPPRPPPAEGTARCRAGAAGREAAMIEPRAPRSASAA